MASSINVNQNNNTVSLQDQNRKITITDNVQEKTVNVTQPVTDIVNVITIGPQGPSGASGPSGSQGPAGSSQDTGSLLTTASYSNPNLTFTKGDGNTFNVEISTTTPSLSQVMAQGKNTNFAITSSADISSSGDLYSTNIILPDTSKVGWDVANAANNINLTGKAGILTIFSGSTFTPALVPKIQIDASNANLTSSGNITANIISASRFEGGGIDGRNDRVNFTAPLTASIISASGTVVGSNVTATNATDITSLKTQTPFLFTLQTSSTQGPTIFSESIAGFTPDGTIGGGTVGVLYFSSQSANGVKMTGADPSRNPTDGGQYFEDVGSQITLISTSSGKFVRIKVAEVTSKVQQFQYNFLQGIMITGSGGYPDQGDTVEMIWDNSAGVGTIQGTGVTNIDTSINKIEIAYRSSSGIYGPNVLASLGDESPVSLASTIYAIPFISKSADLTINSLTTVGNVSASGELRASTINLFNTDKLVSTGSEGKIEISSGSLKLYDDDESHFFFTTDGNNAISFTSNTIGEIMNLSLSSNKIQMKQPTGFGNPSSLSSFERVVIKAIGTTPSRNCFRVTDSSNNTFFKISDNSKIRLGDNGIPTASLDIVGDLRISTNITASGDISASGTGSFAQISLPDLPTADPGIAGRLFTTQSTGTGGNLDGQKILLVSAG